MSELDPAVRELAAAYGVATEYWDWQGGHVEVGVATVLAVLGALGIDASSPERARDALTGRRDAYWRRMLPTVLVVRTGTEAWFPVHVPHGAPVEVWVELEDGGVRGDVAQRDHWVDPQPLNGGLVGEATFALPGDLPLGWHRLRARSGLIEADVPLVVTPAVLGLPPALGDRRVWGFLTHLYQVRSTRSWGIGDLADLADLAAWSGHELGAGFVLVNPLHAACPVPPIEPSPYLPVTRRFAGPLYLRVEAIPEFAYLDDAARGQVHRLAAPLLAASRTAALLDRDLAWTAKRAALELVASVPLSVGRAATFAAYQEREGLGLRDFATWSALVEEYGANWHEWPIGLQDPRGSEVALERVRLADRVAFHSRLQWWLDEQLDQAQLAARQAGMPVGVVHDLAVGVHPDGADAWALQGVLAAGVSVGAPPDAFNQQGQDWSQPPWRPDALAELAYAPYRDMLRTVLRHAGGLRVDHVLGLFRLWWIPQGLGPKEGTYVRYDHEAMVGILALEAQRVGALVVGEDLGTVEPWVRDVLRDRGIAGTSVLWFERDGAGRPLGPEHWRELCLATVTTHDLPPSAGYLTGEHVRIRDGLGLLTRPVEEEQAVDAQDREAWLSLLRDRGLLRPGASAGETIEALHRVLAATPSRLLGVALPDAVGQVQAQNQPGTHREYPNWQIPLTDGAGLPVLLDDLPGLSAPADLGRAVTG